MKLLIYLGSLLIVSCLDFGDDIELVGAEIEGNNRRCEVGRHGAADVVVPQVDLLELGKLE